MNKTRLWMQVVGAFYVLQFVMMTLIRAPIRAMAPAGTLALASAGDPVAGVLVDTWVTFGLEVLAIGVGLLWAARAAEDVRALVWTVIAVELLRGIAADLFMVAQGKHLVVSGVWLVIHSVVIVTGLLALKRFNRETGRAPSTHPSTQAHRARA